MPPPTISAPVVVLVEAVLLVMLRAALSKVVVPEAPKDNLLLDPA